MAYAEKGDKNMADPKNAAKNKKRTDKNDEKPTGYKSGQGTWALKVWQGKPGEREAHRR
jgi:hypothetical protein